MTNKISSFLAKHGSTNHVSEILENGSLSDKCDVFSKNPFVKRSHISSFVNKNSGDSEHSYLLGIVSGHAKATPDDISKILTSNHENVIESPFSSNGKNLTQEHFEFAANSPKVALRLAAIQHPKIPNHLVQKLLSDPDYLVATRAEEKDAERTVDPEKLKGYLNHHVYAVVLHATDNPNSRLQDIEDAHKIQDSKVMQRRLHGVITKRKNNASGSD